MGGGEGGEQAKPTGAKFYSNCSFEIFGAVFLFKLCHKVGYTFTILKGVP